MLFAQRQQTYACCLSSILYVQDSKLVIDKYKSGFPIPQDVPFEDLSNMGGMVDNQNNSTSNKQTPSNPMKQSTVSSKQKKRGGLFGLFGSSKVCCR